MFDLVNAIDRELFWPEFEEACRLGDGARFASLILKLIRASAGTHALDDLLSNAKKRHEFSQIRADVSDEDLAAAWNNPGLDNLESRDRAKRLSGQGYGLPQTLERRARRMRNRGFEMPGRRPAVPVRNK
jgi:hypothetical protein